MALTFPSAVLDVMSSIGRTGASHHRVQHPFAGGDTLHAEMGARPDGRFRRSTGTLDT